MTATVESNQQRQIEREAPPASDGSAPSRARHRFGLSIQSKLLVMLLAVSLLSSIVIGVIGFLNGRSSLREAAFERLTTIRELRTEAIEREFAGLQQGVRLDSRNASAVQGAGAFIDAFAKLQASTITPSQSAALQAYYENQFVPQLEKRSGTDFDPAAFVPATPAGRYLQTHYTITHKYDDFDAGLKAADPGDGSDWTKANQAYGGYFTGLVDELGYEDVLVLDRRGNIAYSAYKSVDLGVNIQEEPYASSTLTKAFQSVMRTGSLDEVVTTDFERYLPSLNVPTAWVISPVGSSTNIVGAMAIQIPIDQINNVMTGGQRWQEQGLGDSGEVYLSGSDKLMRSVSRLLVQHRDQYAQTVIDNGTPPTVANRIVEVNGTVLLQPVDFHGVEEAVAGRTGEGIFADYTNRESLVAWAPVRIDGLNWVVVAHVDAAEAFAPVNDFTRSVVISLLAIILVVSLLSLLLAQVFTRPISRLAHAVRRLTGGDLAVQVPQGSRDEIGELGTAFNDMAASLRVKQDLIEAQQLENEKLMHTLMPESVAKRYREGEQSIAEQHDNVTVLFAELTGFDDYAKALSGNEEVALLNSLMREFDQAAQRVGVEKVRTLRGGYLISSGLVIPRVDHVRRATDFAREMNAVLERFNAQHGTAIGLRAGIDSGSVTSGLVARTNLAYDLWGEAVSLAYRVGSVSGQPGIYLSQSVKDQLADSTEVLEAGSVDTQGRSQTVWRLVLS